MLVSNLAMQTSFIPLSLRHVGRSGQLVLRVVIAVNLSLKLTTLLVVSKRTTV